MIRESLKENELIQAKIRGIKRAMAAPQKLLKRQAGQEREKQRDLMARAQRGKQMLI
jgi:hypothetical protein